MIEKIMEQLEEEREYSYANFEEYVSEKSPYLDAEYDDCFHRGLERAANIVQKAAKEYEKPPVVKEILTSEKDGGWIPTEKKLPKDNNIVLVTDEDGIVAVCRFVESVNVFMVCWDGDEFKDVIAWQPLPAPYQKGE